MFASPKPQNPNRVNQSEEIHFPHSTLLNRFATNRALDIPHLIITHLFVCLFDLFEPFISTLGYQVAVLHLEFSRQKGALLSILQLLLSRLIPRHRNPHGRIPIVHDFASQLALDVGLSLLSILQVLAYRYHVLVTSWAAVGLALTAAISLEGGKAYLQDVLNEWHPFNVIQLTSFPLK